MKDDEMRSGHKFIPGNPERKRSLGDLRLDGRITLIVS
jgi:hypothetical protein